MELRNATVVLLGGSGLVGHAVARRLLEKSPRRLVLVALYEHEVREAAQALDPYRESAEIDVEWGNVFLPAPVARLERSAMLADPAHRALVLGDLLGDVTPEVLGRSLLYQILTRYKPDAVVDSINTATAFAYQDMFQSARDLLAQARAGSLTEAAIESHVLTLTLPQLIRHTQLMLEGLRRAGTQAYVKVGTSGTGGMGYNIPYTHSEERPSRTLMTKSAVAGAQSLLLFLMGRTPGAPATVEIKPTATIAWREIGVGPIWRRGKTIPLVDCPEPVGVAEAFQEGASVWRDLGRGLEGVYINTGENGLFARDEFATVTALGQMEFITPEEVADYVVFELEGRPTGRDIVAALDGATAGPTYRAAILRSYALARLDALEREDGRRSIAYEMLGPPRLTKMLYEASLCGLLEPTVRALAAAEPGELADRAHALLRRDAELRSRILSVGLPIVTPDGRGVYRGRTVIVPPAGGDPLAAAPRGWVDLRPAEFGLWVGRAAAMVRQAEARLRPDRRRESGSDVDWTAVDPDRPIDPAACATWVFRFEDRGERIKR
jgi:NAD(P)-dependent dehydrogenase (short-subunit alcohol dehydrogenase family)